MWAARSGSGPAVKALLDKGADPSAKGHHGETALMMAKDAARDLLSGRPVAATTASMTK